MALDSQLRTPIVVGISDFLSLLDQPDGAGVFCPPPPAAGTPDEAGPDRNDVAVPPLPGLRRRLPPLAELNEYQAFATVGPDDPSGDEKAFALTRQCRCIPSVTPF